MFPKGWFHMLTDFSFFTSWTVSEDLECCSVWNLVQLFSSYQRWTQLVFCLPLLSRVTTWLLLLEPCICDWVCARTSKSAVFLSMCTIELFMLQKWGENLCNLSYFLSHKWCHGDIWCLGLFWQRLFRGKCFVSWDFCLLAGFGLADPESALKIVLSAPDDQVCARVLKLAVFFSMHNVELFMS